MRVVVVGAGIAGLAAAHRLVERAPGVEVVVVEQAATAGGKLRTGELAGGPVETGADAFLVRDPAGGPSAAVEFARTVGLGDALVHPAIGRAAIAVDGSLKPIPGGTLMGVPGELPALDGVAAPAAHLDRDGGRPLLDPGEDVAVGVLVRRRLGDEVADRLVDPMLGGVYAGRADGLSLATTMPGLALACRREPTLVGAVRAALADRPVGAGPIFATVAGGMSGFVGAIVERLRAAGVELRFGSPVRSIAAAGPGWRLVVGSTREPVVFDADAVVLALPSRPASRLLSEVDSAVSTVVGQLDYASVALVTLALPAFEAPELSGFLVPASTGYAVKAVTFFGRKWAHQRRSGVSVVRASLGRYGEEQVLQQSDAGLISTVHTELGSLLGPLPAPVDARVYRWGGALPQYAPGHLDRVAAARAALPGTLALAGAGYDGVGIPTCIRSGQAAAAGVLGYLGQLPA